MKAHQLASRVLVAMDRMTSFAMGRPCAIQDEECVPIMITGPARDSWYGFVSFDVDPMIECDDEYWITADPTLAFKQPPGRPSKIAFVNCLIRLLRTLAFASRTIVSPP